jgi:hypothetical protein
MSFESIKDVQDVIRAIVTEKIDAGQRVNMHWVTVEVLNKYPSVYGDDAAFYLITAREYVADQVKRSITKIDKVLKDVGAQLVMDGFEYLQKAYSLELGEDGRELIPIDQISDSDLLARADEYYKMSVGNRKHGDEIVAYVSLRQQYQAVP